MEETNFFADAHIAGISTPQSCRYLKNPFAECYCVNITSASIPKLLLFCAGEFKSCPIYLGRGCGRLTANALHGE